MGKKEMSFTDKFEAAGNELEKEIKDGAAMILIAIDGDGEGIYANILALMADGAARTNKAITDTYNTLYNTEYSTNKIQAQVTKAVKGGALDRTVVKGVVYFTIKGEVTLATSDDTEE